MSFGADGLGEPLMVPAGAVDDRTHITCTITRVVTTEQEGRTTCEAHVHSAPDQPLELEFGFRSATRKFKVGGVVTVIVDPA
jgi:hypothetical protein